MEESTETVSQTALIVRVVPEDDNQGLMKLELRKILSAEARAEEIAVVTPQKAPELLALFNRAYLDASNFFARTKLEQARAEDELAQIRAEILIDKIPGILKEKKLSSSADVRQALIDSDPDYQDAKDRLARLDATVEYMKGKMKFLENAYSSVKKIMDTGNWNMEMRGGRSQLSGEVSGSAPVGSTSRFGQPR